LPILLLGWYLTTTSAQYATHEHYYRWWLGAILITAALVPSIVVSLMWLGASRWEHRQQLNSAVGFINQREAEVRQVQRAAYQAQQEENRFVGLMQRAF